MSTVFVIYSSLVRLAVTEKERTGTGLSRFYGLGCACRKRNSVHLFKAVFCFMTDCDQLKKRLQAPQVRNFLMSLKVMNPGA
jgi:hypothetical protein